MIAIWNIARILIVDTNVAFDLSSFGTSDSFPRDGADSMCDSDERLIELMN